MKYNNEYSGQLEMKSRVFRGREVIVFNFNSDYTAVVSRLKEIGATYSAELGAYYLEKAFDSSVAILDAFRGLIWVDLSGYHREKKSKARYIKKRKKREISEEREELRCVFEHTLRASNYSENSISIYSSALKHFFHHFTNRDLGEISNDEFSRFISEELTEEEYSVSYKRQMVSAVKMFYKNRFKRQLDLDALPSPRKTMRLPKVLAKQEVKSMIESTPNPKHKIIIMLLYGCGLRMGELLQLRWEDINRDRRTALIRNSKGNKDRYVPISGQMLGELEKYWKQYQSKTYVIESREPGTKYSSSSVGTLIKQSARRAGIKRNVHAHMLRHSYATHLLESGTDTRYIQQLLGHKSSKTTEIYTYVSNRHVSEIPNPFDNLFRED